jgi:hypothetical protein
MKHQLTVKYKGGFSKLAEDLGNLQYDALGDFLLILYEKINRDAEADKHRGRKKLSKYLKLAAKNIQNAWQICVPYMGMKREEYPETKLEEKYLITDGWLKNSIVLAVDGEKYFAQPGISHGFVHFADPKTKGFIGFSGVTWFKKNSIKV